MIEVRNLSKKYGSNLAVDNLSFTVEKGKIYGFLGLNGAGKSTTMNIITGCLAPTEGEVYIAGHSIMEEPVEAKAHIGYLPELPPLYTDMTPREYLSFVAEAKGVRRDKIAAALEDVMSKTDIKSVENRLIRNLSKGYRQRVGIAMAMLGDPDVIVLDEPTVGLDPQQIIEIRDLIRSLGEDHTVILSSHILTEIASVCERIIVISGGKLVANDTMENISRSLRTEITMDITVKASEEEVDGVLSSIEGVTSYRIEKTDGETTSAKVKYPTEYDLRETISFAFSDIRRAVLSMTVEEEGLEEIFLKLTEGDKNETEIGTEYEPDFEYFDGGDINGDANNASDVNDDADDIVDDIVDIDDDGETYVYDPKDYLGNDFKVSPSLSDEYDDNDDDDDDDDNDGDDDNDNDDNGGDGDYRPLFGRK